MIAIANPGNRAAVESVAGTKSAVRDQFERIWTSTQESSVPASAATRLITALSLRIIRSTRLRRQPIARKIPNSFVRSITDISIVLRTLANDSATTIAVIAQA